MHRFAASLLFLLIVVTETAQAQHLWWDTRKLKDATCLYGEITVLASHHAIYYCGANWHPGEPAGGYCGIQHNSPTQRRTIFSVWDTSPKLHPKITAADPKTVFNRFGGEGEGAHTHMLWNWQLGETFQFFVQKQPAGDRQTTDTCYSVFDPERKGWRPSATINSPNGDQLSERSVAKIGGGGLASFLENFGGQDREAPKLALYRLWLGTSVDSLMCLTQAEGDGTWGQLRDAYFLAEGGEKELKIVFGELQNQYGVPIFSEKGKRLDPISDKPLPRELVDSLKNLCPAGAVKEK